MDVWTALAEAKIREWNERVAEGRASAAATVRIDSYENQLLTEVLALYAQARACTDEAERRALLRRASNRRTELMILLERDRPLLAQTIEARLAAELSGTAG